MKTTLAYIGFCTCCVAAYILYMNVIGNARKARKEEIAEARKRIDKLKWQMNMTEEGPDGLPMPFWGSDHMNRMRAEIDEIKRKYNLK